MIPFIPPAEWEEPFDQDLAEALPPPAEWPEEVQWLAEASLIRPGVYPPNRQSYILRDLGERASCR